MKILAIFDGKKPSKDNLESMIINDERYFLMENESYSDFYKRISLLLGEDILKEADISMIAKKKYEKEQKVSKIKDKIFNDDVSDNEDIDTLDNEIVPECENLKIFNLCYEDVMNGVQVCKDNSSYSLDYGFSAASNKGDRNGQEDSVIIMEHPKDENVKLLAISDGMGGHSNGELASTYTLQNIILAFENMPDEYLDDTKKIEDYFLDQIIGISLSVKRAFPNAGATLSMAIVLKDETIIFNIGDSRVYTSKDGELFQQTEDDSIVQRLYDLGTIPEKDLMRFHYRSNEICNFIGFRDIYVNSSIISNDYDTIFAVSDGVCGYLSDEDIKLVLDDSSDDDIAKNLVANAVVNVSELNSPMSGYATVLGLGNHDNATAASLVIKKSK